VLRSLLGDIPVFQTGPAPMILKQWPDNRRRTVPVSAATDSHALEPLRDHRLWMPSRVWRFVSGTYR
jgi:hypothetical protein